MSWHFFLSSSKMESLKCIIRYLWNLKARTDVADREDVADQADVADRENVADLACACCRCGPTLKLW
jgi:hypothetical protein